MSKRWFNNFCAVCVVVLYCAILVATTGCASVKMTKTGDDLTWESRTWFKDIQGVEAGADGFDFSLGSSTGNMSVEQTEALACVLNPEACK